MKTKVNEGDEDDVLKQNNKAHKGIRDKLKKKRKNEKEIKKKKKEKRKEMKLKELKKKKRKEKKEKKKEKEESDAGSDSEENKLKKYLKKLKVFMEEEADDLFEMFETLDAGGEVEIEGLESSKIKNYLRKIFKYLKLKKNPETNEYSIDPDIHTEKIKPKIQDLWYEGVDTSSSDSDDDKKGDKSKDMQVEEDEETQEQKEVNEIDLEKAKNALLEGLKGLPEEVPKEEAKPEVKRIQGEEWRSFLDEKFGSLVGDDKKGYSKLGKKVGVDQEEQRTDRDKKIDDFMSSYNSQFRKKTLLEEHQERKRGAAREGEQERRPFDRDLDLNMSRIDSKKVFQMITNKDNNLSSRFGHSSSGNKYL